MPTLKKLDHIAIATNNLDESLAFYRDALGLTASHVEDVTERGVRVAFLPIGDTRIELVAPLRPDSEVSAFLEKRGAGIHHLCFSTDDVDGFTQSLTERGVKMAQAPGPGAHGCRVSFVHPKASGGTLIELSTPPKP